MRRTVAIDVGTSRVKLGYLDEEGMVCTARVVPTPVIEDELGLVHDLGALLALVEDFLRALPDPERLERIAVCGVGEAGGLVGPDGLLRSPVVVWHDRRGADRLAGIDPLAVYRVTGLPLNANYALSKIAWAVEQAGPAAEGAVWLNVSEIVAAHLTGRRWAEPSLASRTMALDLRARTWSSEVCALLGLGTDVLPEILPASHGEPVRSELAARLGISPEVQVHVAGHDHMVGGVGAGLRPGELLNSTGTTEGLLELRPEPLLDEEAAASRLSNGLACDGAAWTLFASIPTGGSVFATLRRLLGVDAARLESWTADLAARLAVGAIDLSRVPLVVPHFRGSPPPEKSAEARAVVANLGDDTSPEDLVLGCFLGMAVQLREVHALFRSSPQEMTVIGPATRNPLWLQLKADVTGLDVLASTFEEVVSRGAQILASDGAEPEPLPTRRVEADAARGLRLRAWYEEQRAALLRPRGADR